jgi:hypothetical protein
MPHPNPPDRERDAERRALEEDLHRYDDVDPGLNDAFWKQFPEARIHARMMANPPDPAKAFPGRPRPDDFDLPDAMSVEQSYQPPAPPGRFRGDVDLYPIVEPYAAVWKVQQEWLWPGRIPRGSLTLLAGDPSVGKSRLAVELAARVSSGTPWPCDPHPQPELPCNVVLLTAEDSPEREVRARLVAAGADLNRVINFHCVGEAHRSQRKHTTRGFRIPQDVPGLDHVLNNYEPVKLLVIDTLADFWGGGGMRNNAEVRACLAPLVEVASRRRTAVVCVAHLNKRYGLSGLYRTMDSLAFTAVARAVWGIARDPRDTERRLMLPVKMNLAAPPTGLAFRIADDRVQWETGPADDDWQEVIDENRRASSARSARREFTTLWLRDLLSAGALPQAEIEKRARALGVGTTLLKRIKTELAIESDKRGFGKDSEWFWTLAK